MNSEKRFLESFGKRLSTVRRKKGLTQEELADAAEVHRTYVGFIEQGKRNPSIGNVNKMAKALKINLADLLKGL